MSVSKTEYGFDWGGVKVTRVAALPQGHRVLEVSTEKSSVTIYVSPGGRKIRVFENNSRELV